MLKALYKSLNKAEKKKVNQQLSLISGKHKNYYERIFRDLDKQIDAQTYGIPKSLFYQILKKIEETIFFELLKIKRDDSSLKYSFLFQRAYLLIDKKLYNAANELIAFAKNKSIMAEEYEQSLIFINLEKKLYKLGYRVVDFWEITKQEKMVFDKMHQLFYFKNLMAEMLSISEGKYFSVRYYPEKVDALNKLVLNDKFQNSAVKVQGKAKIYALFSKMYYNLCLQNLAETKHYGLLYLQELEKSPHLIQMQSNYIAAIEQVILIHQYLAEYDSAYQIINKYKETNKVEAVYLRTLTNVLFVLEVNNLMLQKNFEELKSRKDKILLFLNNNNSILSPGDITALALAIIKTDLYYGNISEAKKAIRELLDNIPKSDLNYGFLLIYQVYIAALQNDEEQVEYLKQNTLRWLKRNKMLLQTEKLLLQILEKNHRSQNELLKYKQKLNEISKEYAFEKYLMHYFDVDKMLENEIERNSN